MNTLPTIKCGLAGRFRLVVRKADTLEPVQDTGWMNNLILNAGLNRMGDSTYGNYCQVGAGNIAPNVDQTQLSAHIAGTNSTTGNSNGRQSSAPYFGWARRTYRFGAGAAAGTLAEVGIGWGGDGATLFSRALIVDTSGVPTTVTVLSDEVLDVTYELRTYPDLVDKAFTTNISGVEHSCILRAGAVTSDSNWSPTFGAVVHSSWPRVFNGSIGPITGSPNGTNTHTTNRNNQPYVEDSFELVMGSSWSLTQGNVAGGISAFAFPANNCGYWQVSFDPPIDKDSTKTMTLVYKVMWGRYGE